jgi:Transposase and inactivated derivatives
MHDRHILLKRQANLDIREQLILSAWTGSLKDLGVAYELKEEFYRIWEAQSQQEALIRLKKWREHIPEQLIFAFKDLLTALKNWHDEIFAYFDHPITNAYTECLNGLIRVMNRMGRGYSFDALRAKILFTEGTQKVKRLNYKQQEFSKSIASDRSVGQGIVTSGMVVATIILFVGGITSVILSYL